MSDEIVFYHHPLSRGRIVHWMLEEVGAPYRLELVRFDKNEQKGERFLAVNPMGKVPALVHRGVVITEAAAICVYLADAFPEARLGPSLGDPARGTYLRWLFFAAGCVDPAMFDRSLQRTPGRASAIGSGSYEDTVRVLEQALTPGPYILGDTFSAADVYVASQIGAGLMIKGLEPRPAFQAYLARVAARPAFVRCNEQNEQLVAQLKK